MAYERQKQYAETRRRLRELFGVGSEDDYSVILWQPIETPPDDASYILVKTLDTDGDRIYCSDAAYEKGQFLSLFYNGTIRIIDRQTILGWSYYPYDDRIRQINTQTPAAPPSWPPETPPDRRRGPPGQRTGS